MGVLIELLSKVLSIFRVLYDFFVKLMAVQQEDDQQDLYEYILHIRVKDSEDQDFYIAKKVSNEPSLRIPNVEGILAGPVIFKKSDNHTYLASVIVTEEDAPELLRLLTHIGFFLSDTIRMTEIEDAS